MLALAIREDGVKAFMNRLLREDLFDAFEVRGVELYALTRVEISCAAQSGEFLTWGRIRPLVTEVIKYGGKPRSVKIIFSGDETTTASVHPNASALFLNLAYENGSVTFTAATAQKQFTMDKALDAHWEEYVKDFFKQAGVLVSLLT